jgi:gliding motility-associated-like protein
MNITAVTNNIRCNGETNGSISISVTGGNLPYTYSWGNTSSSTASISGLSAGIYSVTVSDNIDCTISQSYTISEPEKLNLEIIKEDVECYNTATGKISLTATGGDSPYNYGINNGISNTAGRIHNNLYAGAYSVYVRDDSGCLVENDLLLMEPAPLEVSYNTSNPTCRDNNDGYIEVLTSGGTSPYLYSWGGIVIDTCIISGLEHGMYNISVTDANNCTKTINTVSLTDNPVDCIQIPDAFTPNADGINDTWIIDNIELFPDATISVFNRWGQLLYQARGDAEAWDGTYNDRFVPTGSYIYIVELHRGTRSYNGVVTVIY